jgi:hypothetical protein
LHKKIHKHPKELPAEGHKLKSIIYSIMLISSKKNINKIKAKKISVKANFKKIQTEKAPAKVSGNTSNLK